MKDGNQKYVTKRCTWSISAISLLLPVGFLMGDTIHVPRDQPTIQAGIDAAVNGDTVLVQPGDYVEKINFAGKNIVVGSLFLTSKDTSYISKTVLDGNNAGSVVTFAGGEDTTAILSGFTITKGSSFGEGGGGIYCSSSSPRLENLRLLNNYAARDGGGIFCASSNPILENLLIELNNCYGDGAGIYCFQSNPRMRNLTLRLNESMCGDAGGIYLAVSDPTMENLVLDSNSSYGDGGGLYMESSNPSLFNVTMIRNSADDRGGGIYCENSDPLIMNVTMHRNAAEEGGAIYAAMDSNPILVNSILWEDIVQSIFFMPDNEPNSITVAYSDIQNGKAGIVINENATVNWLEGNIAANPKFVDTNEFDYRLSQDSPCLSAGIDSIHINGAWYFAPTLDSEGGIRPNPLHSRPDIGAFESAQGIVTAIDAEAVKVPVDVRLNQNYPNPFNPETTISYQLQETTDVTLIIYAQTGHRVKVLVDRRQPAGFHQTKWHGRNAGGTAVASGVYYYRLTAGSFEESREMVLVR